MSNEDTLYGAARFSVNLRHSAGKLIEREAALAGKSKSGFLALLFDLYLVAQEVALEKGPPEALPDAETLSVALPPTLIRYARREANDLGLGVSAFFRFLVEYYKSNQEDARPLATGAIPRMSLALLAEGRPRSG